jgi:hypothetical protein
MSTANITLNIPENIYQRLVNTANATKRPLEDILLQAITVGSPPALDDIPQEYQTQLADLEQLDDQSLWQIATQKKADSDLELFDILLEKNKSGNLTETEQLQLKRLRYECDLFMLRKAHSAALLRWRGYQVPNN